MLPMTGALSLVNWSGSLSAQDDDCLTTTDILGPYYRPNSPYKMDMAEGELGERLHLSGTVYANDCVTPIAEAVVDVWQANADGAYHDVKFRAKIRTDANGHFEFLSVLPGKYLNGSQYRPRHMHFMVHYKEQTYLTTQIYFKGDSSIGIDPWASDPAANERIIDLQKDKDNAYHGVTNFTIDVSPVLTSVEADQVAGANFLVFPVPAIGESIQVSIGSETNGKLVLTDLNGLVVYTTTTPTHTRNFTIQLVDSNGIRLPKGLYALYLVANQGTVQVKRFSIQ